MTRHMSKTLTTITALGMVSLATPVASQSAMSAAQCETMMMVGTQSYAPTTVAGCTAYFQTLARNATAPGTFSASAMAVNLSSSGPGG